MDYQHGKIVSLLRKLTELKANAEKFHEAARKYQAEYWAYLGSSPHYKRSLKYSFTLFFEREKSVLEEYSYGLVLLGDLLREADTGLYVCSGCLKKDLPEQRLCALSNTDLIATGYPSPVDSQHETATEWAALAALDDQLSVSLKDSQGLDWCNPECAHYARRQKLEESRESLFRELHHKMMQLSSDEFFMLEISLQKLGLELESFYH